MMRSKRLRFDSWGIQPKWLRPKIPSCCMLADDDVVVFGWRDAKAGCVASAIERATGLSVVNMQSQGSDNEGNHYQITLGRPLPRRYGGGYSVEGSLWVKVPHGQMDFGLEFRRRLRELEQQEAEEEGS